MPRDVVKEEIRAQHTRGEAVSRCSRDARWGDTPTAIGRHGSPAKRQRLREARTVVPEPQKEPGPPAPGPQAPASRTRRVRAPDVQAQPRRWVTVAPGRHLPQVPALSEADASLRDPILCPCCPPLSAPGGYRPPVRGCGPCSQTEGPIYRNCKALLAPIRQAQGHLLNTVPVLAPKTATCAVHPTLTPPRGHRLQDGKVTHQRARDKGKTRVPARVTRLQSPCPWRTDACLVTVRGAIEKGDVKGSARPGRPVTCQHLLLPPGKARVENEHDRQPGDRGPPGPVRLHRSLSVEASSHSEVTPPLPDTQTKTPFSPDISGWIRVGHVSSRRNGVWGL